MWLDFVVVGAACRASPGVARGRGVAVLPGFGLIRSSRMPQRRRAAGRGWMGTPSSTKKTKASLAPWARPVSNAARLLLARPLRSPTHATTTPDASGLHRKNQHYTTSQPLHGRSVPRGRLTIIAPQHGATSLYDKPHHRMHVYRRSI